jgi:hydrogenase maturation protein HypF
MGQSAVRISIRGVVQGVGFRPFVYRLAARHRVRGWVLNGGAGVEIHAEGETGDVEEFVDKLRGSAPAAAHVEQFMEGPTQPNGFTSFQIRDSTHDARPTVRVSPDLAVCADCLRELNDPADRRFEYPYINCTNCGPRYSIVCGLPYDRPRTTMAEWPMCETCRREYENPADRRYHAQPTACDICGPGYRVLFGDSLSMLPSPLCGRGARGDGAESRRSQVPNRAESSEALHPHHGPLPSSETETEDIELRSAEAIRKAAALLRRGGIIAVKGIGGYHLACDASNAAAVESLRQRKFRKEKPFAVMVSDLEQARTIAALSPQHERLLCDVARPIVLAPARYELPGVAPDNDSLGVMLPYTPLHHLSFKQGAPSPLVLTSANRSSEPIAYEDEDARERLAGIADAFLVGERPIARRVDDSVVAVRRGRPFMIRRSRGYSPGVVCRLPTIEPILAVGSDLKNSIALVIGGEVVVSQHIGDLGEIRADTAFEETIRDLLAMYELRPEQVAIVHDLHPHFVSTRMAESLPMRRRIAVQHHHAHIASVLAEHDLLDALAIGVAVDGTGYGTDGTIWGGEFFVGGVRTGFARVASLVPVLMPGGDAAARFPVQAAAGFLAEMADLPDLSAAPFYFPRRFFDAAAMVRTNLRCFRSTSAGRLFDAVAALCGFTREATFEGQAAIWLEHQVRQSAPQIPYPYPGLDHRPLLAAIIADRRAGRPIADISAAFHAALAEAIAEKVCKLVADHGVNTVALSGGVFQNELLLDSVFDQLETDCGNRVLTNELVPVNDGGICVGQAAIAALMSPSHA